MLTLLTIQSILLPWWNMSYFDGCTFPNADGIYFEINLIDGVCRVSNPSSMEYYDCLAWNDDKDWDALEQQSGVHVDHARERGYPRALMMTCIGMGLAFIQFAVAFRQWVKFENKLLPAYYVVLSTAAYFLIIMGSQAVGSSTHITKRETFAYTNDCDNFSSFPGEGFFLTNTVGFSVVFLIFFLMLFPEKFRFTLIIDRHSVSSSNQSIIIYYSRRCCHLIRYDMDMGEARPLSLFTQQQRSSDASSIKVSGGARKEQSLYPHVPFSDVPAIVYETPVDPVV